LSELNDIEITSTPSDIAASIAAITSDTSVTACVPYATLYMASRDNEAIPIAVPFAKPK
jgi:hypothetical protein